MYVRSTVTRPIGRVARARNSAPPENVARVGWFATALRAGPGIALLVWWLAYQIQSIQQTGEVTDPLAAAVATTTNTRDGGAAGVLVVGTFAAIGAVYLPLAVRVLRSHSARVVLGLLGAYLIWGLLSPWLAAPFLGLCLVSILAVKGRFLTLDMLIILPVCALSEPRFSWRR